MMFTVYLLMLLGPMSVLAQSAAEFQNGLSGLDRILDLLEEPREMESATATKVNRAAVAGRVTFERVSFSYPGSSAFALQDIELDIEPGETIALVGPSGGGKTTLCNLVARFYDPTAAASSSTAATCATSPPTATAGSSASSNKTCSSSTARPRPTSPTALATPPTPTSATRPKSPTPTNSSTPCRTATKQ